jgi:hypothetical protein
MDPSTVQTLSLVSLAVSIVVGAATLAAHISQARYASRTRELAEEAHRWSRDHHERASQEAAEEGAYQSWLKGVLQSLASGKPTRIPLDQVQWAKRAEREGLIRVIRQLDGMHVAVHPPAIVR